MRIITHNQNLRITTLSFIMLFFTALDLYTQPTNIRFKHLTIEDGLSQNTPTCFIQDDNGFMWIGTKGGVNKYDGYDFSVFKADIHDTTSLSETHVLTMHKDHSGLLWIGTENGLNRFDPAKNTSTRYFHDPDELNSLSDNRVNSICEDSFNEFWIGTGNGLNRLNQEKNQVVRYFKDSSNQTSISGNDIRAVYRDNSGTIWIGTYGGGLNKFDHKTEQFSQYTHDSKDAGSLSDNNVLCVHEDKNGVLWIGTEKGGLNRFDKEKEQFICYKTILNNPYSLNDNHVNAIHEDHSGRLWIGTNTGGVSIFNREKEKFFSYQNDPDNPTSLSGNQIYSLFEDNTGGIWIGCRATGVNYYTQEAERFTLYKRNYKNSNSLNDNMVWCFLEDTSRVLWIGTLSGGLNKFDRTKNIFTHYIHDNKISHSISSNLVTKLLRDRFGVLWVGTNDGLDKFTDDTERFAHYRFDPDNSYSLNDSKIRSLYEDRSGTLWVGTTEGLNKFDRKTEHFTHYTHDPDDSNSVSHNRVYCMYEDRLNNFWVGTNGGGLNKLNRETEQFVHYKSEHKNSFSNNNVLAIWEDRSGNLWIGTYGGGLNKFDREKGLFVHYTEKNGLSNNEVYTILEDNIGNLWLSTNGGLSRFNPKTETFKNYTVEDGLQSNEFNMGAAYKNQKGEMFFGSVNGFCVFFPDSIRDNPHIPPVVITDFQILNKPVSIGTMPDGRIILTSSITETNEITLSYKDNVFSFEFAALHFVTPDKNLYAYMMEGFDKDWIYSGTRRFATYTNLDPGKYVFRFKGSNNDGVWNEEGTSLKITIIPPFWMTLWFHFLCTISFILLIIAIFMYQLNRFRKKREEEEHQRVIKIFSQVLEQGGAAVYRRKLDSEKFDYMGEGIRDITGYEASEFSKSFCEKITLGAESNRESDDTSSSLEHLLQKEQGGKSDRWLTDLKLIAKSGEIIWIRDMMTALRDVRGNCYACFGIMFDITDRKFAEEELVRMSDELLKSSKELHSKNEVMETDLKMACEIQTTLLAKHITHFPLNVPQDQCALQFSHRYIPASSLAGDFFDILPVSDHEVGIIFYDVMGHGAQASLLTFYLRGLIEELMPVAGDTTKVMDKLNKGLNSIMARFYRGIFVTAFYGVVDIRTGKLRFTNAGHPPPFILRRTQGTVESILTDSHKIEPAIGIREYFPYSVNTCLLRKDDIIFLYTDGIYEVSGNDGKIFGKKRLLQSMQNKLSHSPAQLIEDVLSEVHTYSNAENFEDDVCLITMHVKRDLL